MWWRRLDIEFRGLDAGELKGKSAAAITTEELKKAGKRGRSQPATESLLPCAQRMNGCNKTNDIRLSSPHLRRVKTHRNYGSSSADDLQHQFLVLSFLYISDLLD